MLTLTYALVALSVEQKKVQVSLLDLQERIQQERKRKLIVDQRDFECLLGQFLHLDEACQIRNIELYVLPVMRAATKDADTLLADIEALTSMGRILLKAVRSRTQQAFAQGADEIEDLFNSLELYCRHLMKRLAIEEQHLLPLAQRVISSDEWFDIAAQFISNGSGKCAKETLDITVSPFMAAHAAAVNRNTNVYETAI